MNAPQPKPLDGQRDTFFKKGGKAAYDARALDVSDTRGNLLGHFNESQMEARATTIRGPLISCASPSSAVLRALA